jgi:hypothetical protein
MELRAGRDIKAVKDRLLPRRSLFQFLFVRQPVVS